MNPKLCPDCPLTEAWIEEAKKRIKARRLIADKSEPSKLKICMELRLIMKELGVGNCPYYPRTESITLFCTKQNNTP